MSLTIWLTGRPCSGKSTIAKRLKEELDRRGVKAVSLDGDDVRARLNADLGYSDKDRKENLRRVAHVAELFNRNGILVVATFISPTNELRDMVRNIITEFKLCYVNASLETCEERDVKGMYKMARSGQIKQFTGISSPFEAPVNPEITLDTERQSLEDCVRALLVEIGVS